MILLFGSIWTTCLVVIVTVLVVYWLLQKWKYNYPPGPPALPLIGNTLQIDVRTLHKQAFEWSKIYGPVITVRIGLEPIVFVNSIEPALEVLVKKTAEFGSRTRTPSMDVLSYGGKSIGFGIYEPEWKLHKKIASKAIRQQLLGDAFEHRIMDAIETAIVEIDKESGQFDPAQYLDFTVGSILTSFCFGGKYEFEDEDVCNLVKKEEDILNLMANGTWEDFIPGLGYVYQTQKFKEIKTFTEYYVEKFIRTRFKEVESTYERGDIRHFADSLILAQKEAEEETDKEAKGRLDDDHFIQTFLDIFFGGADMARSIRFAVLHMVAFPDIQEKVQAEIDSVVGRARLPGASDLQNLCYTQAVLHESIRLANVTPTGILHETCCDAEVSGYRIPKGTNIAINYLALFSDPEVWDEVDRFIPERYLDEDGKLGPKPKNWLPFSAGTRKCLGESISKPIMNLVFAVLMQRYTWKMVSGMCADIIPDGTYLISGGKPQKFIVERRME